MKHNPIGIFDSGYGGLTVMREIVNVLPGYDYLYLGDNARTPYGSRSFETVYKYTLEAVRWLFENGAPLIILACNTASAKALRTIQQKVLPVEYPDRKVLGVIRPTTEQLGKLSQTGEAGILATPGTVLSGSYIIELEKFSPRLKVYQEACPMWVPLVEYDEYDKPGADYFVKRHIDDLLDQGKNIDTVLLACTHYPLLKEKIRSFLPNKIKLVEQGTIVAEGLKDYLFRHPEIETKCSKSGRRSFFTTDSAVSFERQASRFYGDAICAQMAVIAEK